MATIKVQKTIEIEAEGVTHTYTPDDIKILLIQETIRRSGRKATPLDHQIIVTALGGRQVPINELISDIVVELALPPVRERKAKEEAGNAAPAAA